MKIETITFIEVEGLPGEWAVNIDRCKNYMKPVVANYIFVHNDSSNKTIYVENLLTDILPIKTIPELNKNISEDFIEVGFWRVKYKN